MSVWSDSRITALAEECARAIGSRATGTIRATLFDAYALARRDTANAAGALLRDRARELEASAEEHARQEDGEEADLLHSVAHELSKLSDDVYALGSDPEPEPKTEAVDDDIAF